MELKEAFLWKKINNKIKCELCRRNCIISENSTGFCRVRQNIKGKLYSLVYGRTLSLAIDPIEKKPLFHFKPTTLCTSMSTFGCNFRCLHCQNYFISQLWLKEDLQKIPYTKPAEIVDFTLRQNIPGIAYTYTEPTIFAEYAYDTMVEAKKFGLYNVWVSNGYFSKKLLQKIAPYLDAINVDLKGDEKFYQEVCGNAHVKFVKENIKLLVKEFNIHTEVTYLIIPGYNDKEEQIKDAITFVAKISKNIPMHFTRFFPAFRMKNVQPTPIDTLKKAKLIAKEEGLNYVYLGNIPEEENTYCHNCGNLLIKRIAYSAEIVGLEGNKCKKCGAEIPIII